MEYQIVTLSIIAILNAIFSYFIVRGKKNFANTFFSLVTLSVSLWALCLAFFIKVNHIEDAVIFANAYYIFAGAIPLLFLFFSLVFLEEKNNFNSKYYLFTIPLLTLLILFLIDKNILLQKIFLTNNFYKDVILNKPLYFGYAIYFILFVLISYYVLLQKYSETKDITQKLQLKFIIFGTAISFILGMFFNLILPWFENYNYIWLGPPFSLIMVISIGYAIIKHHLFNEKVIATEILTFSIIFFILVRTIIADTLQEQIINGLLLLAVSVAGILLIRSVIHEVKTREKIERLARDLKTANIRLKKLDKQKSEFVSIASHQLRSPIASLKGYSSMVLEGSYGRVSEDLKEVMEKIYQSSQSISLIIDDFLNLSRIERGEIKYYFVKANVKNCVEEALNQTVPLAKDKGLKVKIKLDKGNYQANIDEEKIRQMITNIIDNAIKYTPKGFININLSKKDNKILIKISDSGIGIPKNQLNKLFKKFSRLENANEANTKGTGLGLYLAKQITEAHNGKIWAESEGKNKGASFFVELKAN